MGHELDVRRRSRGRIKQRIASFALVFIPLAVLWPATLLAVSTAKDLLVEKKTYRLVVNTARVQEVLTRHNYVRAPGDGVFVPARTATTEFHLLAVKLAGTASVTSDEVLAAMYAKKLRPATVIEVLLFFDQYDSAGIRPLVALGAFLHTAEKSFAVVRGKGIGQSAKILPVPIERCWTRSVVDEKNGELYLWFAAVPESFGRK